MVQAWSRIKLTVLRLLLSLLLTDVAVGAPFEGEDGSGAVYIYHGSSKGIETHYRQVCCG